jgi:hypothetical protein
VETASKGSSFEFEHAIEKGGRRTEKETFEERAGKSVAQSDSQAAEKRGSCLSAVLPGA